MSLTERETEVLELCCAGLGHKQIGKQLRISNRTVEQHQKHIRKKLGVRTMPQAAFIAATRGLVLASPPRLVSHVEACSVQTLLALESFVVDASARGLQ